MEKTPTLSNPLPPCHQIEIAISEAEARITKAIVATENKLLGAIHHTQANGASSEPDEIERRIRDLEIKAMMDDARDESAKVMDLRQRLKKLEARVLQLEKGTAST
jgi:hypothetical protein